MSNQQEEQRKMCDECGSAPVMGEDDVTNKVLDDLFTSDILDSEVHEWVGDEFANKQVCAACFFEYIGMKQRVVTDSGYSQYYIDVLTGKRE
jgi:hypothetical protein